MPPLTITGIDELRELIGKPIGPSDWLEVTQEDIDKFAEVSRDDQWIHVDAERAERESPFGTTVAHGNLTLSLIDGFRGQLIDQQGVKLGINYGWDKVRFPAPVPAGSKVRATAEVPVGRRARRRLVARRHPVHARARGRREAGLRRRLGRPRPARVARRALSRRPVERSLHAGLAVAVDRAEERVVVGSASTSTVVRVAGDDVGAAISLPFASSMVTSWSSPDALSKSIVAAPAAAVSSVSVVGERAARVGVELRRSMRAGSPVVVSVVGAAAAGRSSSLRGRRLARSQPGGQSSSVDRRRRPASISTQAREDRRRRPQSPGELRPRGPRRTAVTPSRRSSVAIESAIPWRSSWRCSASELSRLSPTSSFAIRT